MQPQLISLSLLLVVWSPPSSLCYKVSSHTGQVASSYLLGEQIWTFRFQHGFGKLYAPSALPCTEILTHDCIAIEKNSVSAAINYVKQQPVVIPTILWAYHARASGGPRRRCQFQHPELYGMVTL